jgi:hypothetical protein
MSAIWQISRAFSSLLSDALEAADLPHAVKEVDPSKFKDEKGASVWLYQTVADEFSRNGAKPVIDDPADPPRRRSVHPPLGVNLSYLVTPMTGNIEEEQDVLSQILLTIHESPVLTVRDLTLGLNEQVRIYANADNFEERMRLWETLKDKPYQLSFICVLRTARLFSSQAIKEVPVRSLAGASGFDAESN